MDIGSTLHNPDRKYETLYTPIGYQVIISDYAPLQSVLIRDNSMIISEDNFRKMIWKINKDFDVALEEVCNFIKERLMHKIDVAFNYNISNIPRLVKK